MIPHAVTVKFRLTSAPLLRASDRFHDQLGPEILENWRRPIKSREVTGELVYGEPITGELLGISAMGFKSGVETFTTAVLTELWEANVDCDGPLKSSKEALNIPTFTATREARDIKGDDSLVSPLQYFVCEKRTDEKLTVARVKGLPGTFLRCAYGPDVVLEVAMAKENQPTSDDISPLTGKHHDTFKFDRDAPYTD